MDSDKIIQKLKDRGEPIWCPNFLKEMKHDVVIAYVKGSLPFVCGYPVKEKDGTISLEHDFLCYYETGYNMDELGLCNGICWYHRDEIDEQMPHIPTTKYMQRLRNDLEAVKKERDKYKAQVERIKDFMDGLDETE